MDTTVGFSTSNRCGNTPTRDSHCRLFMQTKGRNKIAKIGNIFDCGGTTNGPMGKWTPQLDSAHQIGAETPPLGILIVGCLCKQRGGIKLRKSETFLIVEEQPMVLWVNGHYGWIQHIK